MQASKMQLQRRGASVAAPRRGVIQGARPSRKQLTVCAAKALIVNTKGGGHAFIGLYTAKALIEQGHQVTIVNDGDPAKLLSKDPFAQYASLPDLKVVWGNPAAPKSWPTSASIEHASYDIVYDNNGKDLACCKPLIDASLGKVKHYVFVSSAGAYKANDIEPCHFEGDARKSSAGHVEVEKYLEDTGIPYTVFQPLYIYGPHTAKDCEQWFIDRIVRDRPVPIPVPGVQLVSLSHVEDVASMLAAVPAAGEWAQFQYYNVCSDRCISFTGICNAVGKALGKEPKIVLYDPVKLGLGKAGKAEGFPFRTIHFFANPDKAKRELGWAPAHTFLDDVDALVADYYAKGRQHKDIDFSLDDKILGLVGARV